MELTLKTLLLIVLIVSMTHFLGSFAAYGSSLLAMPFFMAATGDLEFSIGVLLLMGLVQAAVILRRNHHSIDWRRLWLICGGLVLGAPIGVLLVDRLPRREILLLLGFILVASGGIGLVSRQKQSRAWPHWVNLIVLMAAGAVHGAFASGGSVLILYARHTFREKEVFRATLAAVWLVINSILLLRLFLAGELQNRVWPAAGVAAVVVVVAGVAAEHLIKGFSQRAFLILISVLLVLSGVVTLFRAV